MKQSRYCFLFGIEDGKGLVFSSANGALAELDSESYPQVKSFLSECLPPKSGSNLELWNALIDNAFLVEDNTNEIVILETGSQLERSKKSTLSLTIAPTLACNFGCDYCFENHSATHMSKATEEALVLFAERHIKDAKSLQTTWFGGEPTLCLPTIERLQSEFTVLADRSGVSFDPSSIITNGYLLNSKMAMRLKHAGIVLAQVTLDGPKEVHDARRPLKNGRGTFDRILENISQASEILSIAVRINVDRDNIDASIQIIEDLKNRDILPHINVHFAQVTASGSACSSVRDRCFSDQEFSQRQALLYKTLIDRDIYMVDYPQVFSGGHCGAVSEGSFVISPTGDIFKCWEELSVDSEKSTGSILTDTMTSTQRDKAKRYKSWDPFELKECRSCEILPVCMGGCPVQGLQNGDPDKGACSPFKYSLKEMLVLRYLCNQRKEVTT